MPDRGQGHCLEGTLFNLVRSGCSLVDASTHEPCHCSVLAYFLVQIKPGTPNRLLALAYCVTKHLAPVRDFPRFATRNALNSRPIAFPARWLRLHTERIRWCVPRFALASAVGSHCVRFLAAAMGMNGRSFLVATSQSPV